MKPIIITNPIYLFNFSLVISVHGWSRGGSREELTNKSVGLQNHLGKNFSGEKQEKVLDRAFYIVYLGSSSWTLRSQKKHSKRAAVLLVSTHYWVVQKGTGCHQIHPTKNYCMVGQLEKETWYHLHHSSQNH